MTTQTRTKQADLDIEYLDALSGQNDYESESDGSLDERQGDSERRRRNEKRDAEVEKKLDGEHAVAVYRAIARKSRNLTDTEYRVLDVYLGYSTRLTNCFPSRKTVLKELGGHARTMWRLNQVIRALKQKGWMGRIRFTEGDLVAMPDEALEAANYTGRFISATGRQFRIPPNEIAPGHSGKKGPIKFDKRLFGQRRAADAECSHATSADVATVHRMM